MVMKGFSAITGVSGMFTTAPWPASFPQWLGCPPSVPMKAMFQTPPDQSLSITAFLVHHCCWLAEMILPVTCKLPTKPPLA